MCKTVSAPLTIFCRAHTTQAQVTTDFSLFQACNVFAVCKQTGFPVVFVLMLDKKSVHVSFQNPYIYF